MTSRSSLLESIRNRLSTSHGWKSDLHWVHDLPGGDINRAALLRSHNTSWFLKYHADAPTGMFEAEATALQEIGRQGCIQAPSPVALGIDGHMAWLLLEYMEFSPGSTDSVLGEQLAALHSVHADYYGWAADNFIGSTPQDNSRCDNWTDFWRERRLRPQLVMAHAGGHGGRLLSDGERLLSVLDQLMDGHKPAASLLHGDLWAGNKASTTDGQPVIFDPASYYGDHETDIAMTRLFGGFGPEFYAAYEANMPLASGHRLRQELYNLYHMLNHLNLFGRGYLARCENIIANLLAEAG